MAQLRAVLRINRLGSDYLDRWRWWQRVFDQHLTLCDQPQRPPGTEPSHQYPNPWGFRRHHRGMMNSIITAYARMQEGFWLIDADDTEWPGHTEQDIRDLLRRVEAETTTDLASLDFYSGWQGHQWWTFGVAYCRRPLTPDQILGFCPQQWLKKHPDCLFDHWSREGSITVSQWIPRDLHFRHVDTPWLARPQGHYKWPHNWPCAVTTIKI